MNLGGYDDYRYRQLYDSLMNASTGQVERLYEYLENRNYEAAQLENEQLQQNEEWVSYIKTVTNVYLRTWAEGIMEITRDDQDLLWPIALTTPYEGGPGVYTARVMLGIDPEDYAVPYHSLISVRPGQIESFRIIPNPASGEIKLVFDEAFNEAAVIELYDLRGAKQQSINFTSRGKESSIILDNLPSGLYFCKIISKSFNSDIQKLVIIK